MHTEHNTLKWCAVISALIISIAIIAGMFYLPIPGYMQLPEEGPAITRIPDGMPETVKAADLKKYETSDIEATKTENVESQKVEVAEQLDPVNITVNVDGLKMNLMSAPVAIVEILDIYNIPMGKDDTCQPATNQHAEDGMEITVSRITFEEVVESEAIPFKTKTTGTDDLPAGTKKVVQKGQKGEDKVTYKITYADGKEIAREEIARKTVKEPVTKIIAKSTVGTIAGAEYSRKFTVKAYSYTGGGTTASGLPAAVGRIAVDPSVIPLGTRVYVEGYGFATAADTGGNINGHTIDVYYNSESQCRSWGCRHVTVYILK